MSGRVEQHFSHVVIVGKVDPDTATERFLQHIMDDLSKRRVKLSLRQGRLRFSFHVYNTQQEVDSVLSMLRQHLS